MDKRELFVGDVVQIDPEYDERFGGCLMIVTDPKSFGAVGGVAIPGEKGIAYYRCGFENMEYVGPATWRLSEPKD